MTITDEVIEAIDREIAFHTPERGGLLFGPIGRNLVSLFVPDETATTTSSTYQISAEMCLRAPEIEKETQLEYKGIVHCHPGTFDSPSSGDERSAANALSENPHLSKFFMPIVTKQLLQNASSHENATFHGKISGYSAYRERKNSSSRPVVVRHEDIRVVPIKGHLREFSKKISSKFGIKADLLEDSSVVFQEDVFQIAYVIASENFDLIILTGEDYPHFSPHVLFTEKSQPTKTALLKWDICAPPAQRLIEAGLLALEEIFNLKEKSLINENLCPTTTISV